MTTPVPVPPGPFAGTLDYLRSWVEYRAWATRTPGVQYAVGLRGQVLLSGAWGMADLTTGEPLTCSHLFRIASHSKTFTATVTMILAARGALRLDDTTSRHLPELADVPAGAFTVRDLLAHSTGVIRDGYAADFWSLSGEFPDEAGLLTMLRDRADVLPPVTRLKYSNIGYSLLGLILERATGATYADLVTDLVTGPLELPDTTAEYQPARAADYAAGHGATHLGRGRVRVPRHVDTRAMAAATGFTSTAADLVRFAAAHSDGDERLLSDADKRRMRQRLWVEDPDASEKSERGYGLGLLVTEIDGHPVIGHSGGYPGHITQTLWEPETGLAVSVLTNTMGGPATEISTGLLRLLFAAGGTDVAQEPDRPDLDSLTGRYANAWSLTDVVRLGPSLRLIHPVAADPMEDSSPLVPDGSDSLRIDGGSGFAAVGEHLVFERDGSDQVVRVHGGGGQTMLPVGEAVKRLADDPAALLGGSHGPRAPEKGGAGDQRR